MKTWRCIGGPLCALIQENVKCKFFRRTHEAFGLAVAFRCRAVGYDHGLREGRISAGPCRKAGASGFRTGPGEMVCLACPGPIPVGGHGAECKVFRKVQGRPVRSGGRRRPSPTSRGLLRCAERSAACSGRPETGRFKGPSAVPWHAPHREIAGCPPAVFPVQPGPGSCFRCGPVRRRGGSGWLRAWGRPSKPCATIPGHV